MSTAEYLAAVGALPQCDHVTLRTGKGLSLAHLRYGDWAPGLVLDRVA